MQKKRSSRQPKTDGNIVIPRLPLGQSTYLHTKTHTHTRCQCICIYLCMRVVLLTSVCSLKSYTVHQPLVNIEKLKIYIKEKILFIKLQVNISIMLISYTYNIIIYIIIFSHFTLHQSMLNFSDHKLLLGCVKRAQFCRRRCCWPKSLAKRAKQPQQQQQTQQQESNGV